MKLKRAVRAGDIVTTDTGEYLVIDADIGDGQLLCEDCWPCSGANPIAQYYIGRDSVLSVSLKNQKQE